MSGWLSRIKFVENIGKKFQLVIPLVLVATPLASKTLDPPEASKLRTLYSLRGRSAMEKGKKGSCVC